MAPIEVAPCVPETSPARVPEKLVAVVAVLAFPPIFKLATGVVDVTMNGAVPVAIVEVN